MYPSAEFDEESLKKEITFSFETLYKPELFILLGLHQRSSVVHWLAASSSCQQSPALLEAIHGQYCLKFTVQRYWEYPLQVMLTSRAATKTMKFAACADLTQLRGSSFHILAQYLDFITSWLFQRF